MWLLKLQRRLTYEPDSLEVTSVRAARDECAVFSRARLVDTEEFGV